MMNTTNKNFEWRNYTLYFAWIVSMIATLGSLFFSEILGFVPCELCWYQRIMMYPLCIILGIATFYNEKNMKKYVLPISIIGGSISIYHYAIQKIPGVSEINPCVQGVPCNVDYINWLGFITIPFLALIAFSFITLFMVLTRSN
ncbi:disulfide bond formation protein B [Bacillus mycoides]|uniref:disulfide oxidoreductase n=1 Tax=Bacillus mycoides TaxID=1405 RepID=UPI000BF5EF8A|nr:disulfide oxidoreductase [Bacillus mycoides]MED1383921.1 disulfide oxidoreductase [Bacillus mycoides]PFX95753.1 disulfide bond formation protein B [Bacillus mycoides]QWH79001.1 disulfide bond formation protein B [Bacillus mycoides]QWI44049.1 disulfide bond formation protein B [Bacillus mycoides]